MDYIYRVTKKKRWGTVKVIICTDLSLVQQIAVRKKANEWEKTSRYGNPDYDHMTELIKIERAAVDNWEEVTVHDWRP